MAYTVQEIKQKICQVTQKYPLIKKVILFGSRAAETNAEYSDVDLIVEFTTDITLLTISNLRLEIEEALGLNVDIIHGPIRENDLIEVNETVEIYAA